jgi:hypothetical protein
MHPNALQVVDHADRLARDRNGGKLSIVFSVVTAVSLGALAAKAVLDLFHENRRHDNKHGQER